MMKSSYNLPVLSLIVFLAISFFLASCGTPQRTDGQNTAGAEPVRELVLTPSSNPVKTYTREEIIDMTDACLWCHEFTYEAVQARTVNYVYKGEIIQPHAYLDMNLTNPHDTTTGIDCLNCHDEHESPEPVQAVRKANLNYCVNCHHTGEMIACAFCH